MLKSYEIADMGQAKGKLNFKIPKFDLSQID